MSYSIQISKNSAQPNYLKIGLRAKSLHATVFERKDFQSIYELEELEQPGLYLLFNGALLYIGEADNLINRLENHLKSEEKSWWSKCICFHTLLSSLDPLNKAMVKYLEYRLIAHTKILGVKTENHNIPAEPFLSDADKYLMESEYVPQVIEILKLFNILPTSENSVEAPEAEKDSAPNTVTRTPSLSVSLEKIKSSVAAKPLSIASDLFSVDSKTKQIQSKHTCSLRLDGRVLTEKNWSVMYLKVIKYLVSIHGEEIFKKDIPSRLTDVKFEKNSVELCQDTWQDDTGKQWYLLTELGTEDKKATIRRFCRTCHCDVIID